MSRFSDQPEPLSDVLRTVAKRVKKVDLTLLEEIQVLWPTILAPAVALRCQPQFMKNKVLVVSVPSGAFAQQILSDQDEILRGLSVLGERAPTSLKTVQNG